MSVGIITILMFGTMLVLLALGTPVAFALGGVAVWATMFLWSPEAFNAVPLRIISTLNIFILVALPLFVFMGVMLERSGIADDLFEMIQQWIGVVRGSLAIGAVWVCTIFAAMVGSSSAATLAVGSASLPSMRKRNYDKNIMLGSIMAGGALGFLIPPSVLFIVYAVFAEESVGRLFAAGVFPGLLLSSLFATYIAVRCFFQPHLAPALPPEESGSSWKRRVTTLRAVILPVLLIIIVIGSMFAGIATPSEAAAAGAFGALLCSAIARRLTWENFKQALTRVMHFQGMTIWIMLGAKCFTGVYIAMGAAEFMEGVFLAIPFGRMGVIIAMMLTLFILGMILDPFGIIMITTPVFIPVIRLLGLDPVWFGVLFILNMEMAFLTPPFGMNLFYMRGLCHLVAPDITMGDIYRSVVPFVGLQMIGLIIVLLFPQIALWLPNLLFGVPI